MCFRKYSKMGSGHSYLVPKNWKMVQAIWKRKESEPLLFLDELESLNDFDRMAELANRLIPRDLIAMTTMTDSEMYDELRKYEELGKPEFNHKLISK